MALRAQFETTAIAEISTRNSGEASFDTSTSVEAGEAVSAIIAAGIDEILLAEEETIRDTVRWVLAELGWQVEPSGCVPLAALRDAERDLRRWRVGVILTGGNFDPSEYR